MTATSETFALSHGPDPRPPGGLKAILADTARDYDLEPEALLVRSSKASIARPRQDFIWRARQLRWLDGTNRYSQPMIAAFLGMDHTSVLHGERSHAARMATSIYCVDETSRGAEASARTPVDLPA